jgi:hypothetical protein
MTQTPAAARTYNLPLVGAHFRPPAKAILGVLPLGAPLQLRREPDNPHDPNAIQVMVASATIPPAAHEDLERAASGYGFDLATILGQPEWHLGYVPRTDAESIAPLMDEANVNMDGLDQSFAGTLAFSPDGKPRVAFDLGQGQ